MALTRKDVVLKYIVEDFVVTAEPVGSKSLLSRHRLPFSSATIRNDMVELENEGFIEKTHTSSGRVPSTKGYRCYVANLRTERIDKTIRYEIDQVFDGSKSIEDVLSESCRVLSSMTNLASCVLGPDTREERLVSIQVIPLTENSFTAIFVTDRGSVENKTFVVNKNVDIDEIVDTMKVLDKRLKGTRVIDLKLKLDSLRPILQDYIKDYNYVYKTLLATLEDFLLKHQGKFYGTENLLEQPEFKNDADEVKSVIELLHSPEKISQLFKECGDEVSISIGNGEFKDISIITKDIRIPDSDEEIGRIAVVGPTRMDYDKVLHYLNYTVEMIMNRLSDMKEVKIDGGR
jgi:heat-inducible transcriptional repressor